MSGVAFAYSRAADVADAVARGGAPGAAFVAGGTDLLQLWKAGRATPTELIDVYGLGLDGIGVDGDELSIGATARLSDVARHPFVVDQHPLIAEAVLASASGQIRNMATVGGNLLQRTRCPYFRTAGMACNKHRPGSGCGALDGEDRHAALFGAGSSCVATHPSDLAVALVALDATVEVSGARGVRRVGLSELYRLPGERPDVDTTLAAGELITRVLVPRAASIGRLATYVKVRDRASFEFALLSVAAVIRIDAGTIVHARLVCGGVAPAPWRLPAGEALLIGQKPERGVFTVAAAAAVEGAPPLPGNSFKVELLRRALVRTLTTIATGS